MSDRERIREEMTRLSRRLDVLQQEFTSVADEESSSDAATIVHAIQRGQTAVMNPQETVVEHPRAERGVAPAEAPPARTPQPSEGDFSGRYVLGGMLGEGGMGEVLHCTDTRIGRSVAIKVIRPEIAKSKKLRARFLAEAKVQGQLEHPAIVPVYDLGVRPDGYEYFTMKRVHGRTLHEVLKDLRLGDRGAANAWWTRRRLLLAFQSVCLAVEYAHQRGVIHRDLKPANVMLGDLGEVSVLDWGLAKVTSREAKTPAHGGVATVPRERQDETAIGEILGTPGYMSPEQAADSQGVDPQSDVFALGSILFELLTLRSMIPGKTPKEASQTTLTGKFERSISKRFPELDMPPELDAIVQKATAQSTTDRYARARQIADALERYLEGDRDVERRRHMASKHTREAIGALAESVAAQKPEAALAARAKAIREVNRALAIDPQNDVALRTMMKIVTDVPTAVIPEAEAAVRAGQMRSRRKLLRRGAVAYVMCTGNVLITLWLGVVSLPWLAATSGFFLAAAAIAFVASRQQKPSSAFGYPLIALTSCGIAATSAIFGPFIYAPGLCAANAVVFSGTDRSLRWAAIIGGVLAMFLPLLAQLTGLVPPSWIFRGTEIAIIPRAVQLPEGPTLFMLAAAAFGTTALPALLVGAERDARAKAERELAVRAYHLAELVPPEAKSAAGEESARPRKKA